MKAAEWHSRPDKEYSGIIDNCRKNLLKYLEKAVSKLPVIDHPRIMDAGCGTGVPALYMAEKLDGTITAVDPDEKSITVLREKINELKLADKITVFNCSLFDFDTDNNPFDIVLAEGLLNVVGFQKGLVKIVQLVKQNGFIIIHDEAGDQSAKMRFIEKNDCKMLASFVLDEKIWWNNYYKCLENKIHSSRDKNFIKIFKSELIEIESFKKNPSLYRSVYYVLERR
jgi:cyclopropane fatty-acyl-phospholipid synthase-like methyltransferase